MRLRILILALLPFLAIFLQSTVLSFYLFKDTVPDLVLIFVIFFALLNGTKKGSVYGVLCGLLEDLYLGRFIGINAISKGFTAFIIGKLQGNVFKDNILVGAIGVIVGTLINAGILFILAFITFDFFNVDSYIFIHVLYQTVYNTTIAIPLYLWYYRSSSRGLLRSGDR